MVGVIAVAAHHRTVFEKKKTESVWVSITKFVKNQSNRKICIYFLSN